MPSASLSDAYAAFTRRARLTDAAAFAGPLLALVPHADDEVLGFGGLYRQLVQQGERVDLVLVTDGVGSHPRAAGHTAEQRRDVREAEFGGAVERLGGDATGLLFWRKPDTQLPHLSNTEETACVELVRRTLERGGYRTVLTPWRRDPHGDHRAITSWVLAALRTLAEPPRLLEYCVWLGHQGGVGDFPNESGGLLKVDVAADVGAKRAALQAHQSQLGGVFDDPEGFVIPDSLAATVEHPFEYYLTTP